MNSKVDDYIEKAEKWQAELEQLRKILLTCGLTEEWKWRAPCYTFQGKNVMMLGALKESCVLSFFKGALLRDNKQILSRPGENTQAARIIRFTNMEGVLAMAATLRFYIFEAVEIEKAGLVVVKEEPQQQLLPEELVEILEENHAFKQAFEALTPGRQRAYNMFFSAPKQSKSRIARVEKYFQRILDGKGLNDCVCGLSKKLPGCDGSHKYLNADQ
mgnify:CR=1 FL=1